MTDEIKTQDEMLMHVSRLVEDARAYLDSQANARSLALEYYSGNMADLPAKVGRSSAVSNDLRATIKKVLPSIMRTLTAGGQIARYMPVGPEDDQGAEQATDYINTVVVPESGSDRAIYDAIHDALVLKTGILKACAYRSKKVTVTSYTGQPGDALLGLTGEPDIEILDLEGEPETDQAILAQDPEAMRYSFTVRRTTVKTEPSLQAVPRGSFILTPGADDEDDAELVGEVRLVTRSDLVSEGYAKEVVWALDSHDEREDDDFDRMGDDYPGNAYDTKKALQIVEVFEVYVLMDMDGDGVAERYRVVFGEGQSISGVKVLLGMEPVAEQPYTSVVIERDPHQFEGHSIYEDVREKMRAKTAILRGSLDNMYAVLEARPVVNIDAVENPERLATLKFGEPIHTKPGFAPQDVVQWQAVPFFAKDSFGFLDYFDAVIRDETGISDKSAGLNADSVQNVSATAAQLMSESGIAQSDMIVRTVAACLRRAFRKLLKLVIAHADGPRTIRIKGEWVPYDPRVWNSDMDCTVNVGLGGGTRERDMLALQTLYAMQKELLVAIGPDNPYVKPEQLYNTLEKITETAGFTSALPYFTRPDPADVQAKIEAARNAPDPEVTKIQAQGEVDMQLAQFQAQVTAQTESAKLQIQAQAEQMKAEVARDKERAQAEADIIVKQREAEIEAQLEAQKLAYDAQKHASEMAFKERELAMKREIELLKISAHAAQKAQADADAVESAGRSDAQLKAINDAVSVMAKPRRVLRDDNGEIVGVEPIN